MKRIVVYNPKGGSGKSTIATNLAAYYATIGNNVLLLDMDAQKSSLSWLNCRSPNQRPIAGGPFDLTAFRAAAPDSVLVVDTPASLPLGEIGEVLRQSSHLIIPLLPSAMDIRAAGIFLYKLLMKEKISAYDLRICVVANRVKAGSLVYKSLVNFLTTINIPFTASLRDSRNYLLSAETGCGIFEMSHKSSAVDQLQWLPLTRWLDDSEAQSTPLQISSG